MQKVACRVLRTCSNGFKLLQTGITRIYCRTDVGNKFFSHIYQPGTPGGLISRDAWNGSGQMWVTDWEENHLYSRANFPGCLEWDPRLRPSSLPAFLIIVPHPPWTQVTYICTTFELKLLFTYQKLFSWWGCAPDPIFMALYHWQSTVALPLDSFPVFDLHPLQI